MITIFGVVCANLPDDKADVHKASSADWKAAREAWLAAGQPENFVYTFADSINDRCDRARKVIDSR